MADEDRYYYLDPAHTDAKRVRKEREKAQKLKKSGWWRERLARGVCHYCGGKFPAGELTMDHVLPIARGGESVKGNVVPACRACNQRKKLETPAEAALRELARAGQPGGVAGAKGLAKGPASGINPGEGDEEDPEDP